MSTQLINRMQFLRGQYKGEQVLRPPWALDEMLFTDNCSRCGDCIRACPLKLLNKGNAGFPVIDFSQHGCDYCKACLQACPDGALQETDLHPPFPHNQTAYISQQCFAGRGILCRSCGEVCEYEAIEFKLALGGISHLHLNRLACDGCGECVHVCPANAIQIQKSNHGENT